MSLFFPCQPQACGIKEHSACTDKRWEQGERTNNGIGGTVQDYELDSTAYRKLLQHQHEGPLMWKGGAYMKALGMLTTFPALATADTIYHALEAVCAAVEHHMPAQFEAVMAILLGGQGGDGIVLSTADAPIPSGTLATLPLTDQLGDSPSRVLLSLIALQTGKQLLQHEASSHGHLHVSLTDRGPLQAPVQQDARQDAAVNPRAHARAATAPCVPRSESLMLHAIAVCMPLRSAHPAAQAALETHTAPGLPPAERIVNVAASRTGGSVADRGAAAAQGEVFCYLILLPQAAVPHPEQHAPANQAALRAAATAANAQTPCYSRGNDATMVTTDRSCSLLDVCPVEKWLEARTPCKDYLESLACAIGVAISCGPQAGKSGLSGTGAATRKALISLACAADRAHANPSPVLLQHVTVAACSVLQLREARAIHAFHTAYARAGRDVMHKTVVPHRLLQMPVHAAASSAGAGSLSQGAVTAESVNFSSRGFSSSNSSTSASRAGAVPLAPANSQAGQAPHGCKHLEPGLEESYILHHEVHVSKAASTIGCQQQTIGPARSASLPGSTDQSRLVSRLSGRGGMRPGSFCSSISRASSLRTCSSVCGSGGSSTGSIQALPCAGLSDESIVYDRPSPDTPFAAASVHALLAVHGGKQDAVNQNKQEVEKLLNHLQQAAKQQAMHPPTRGGDDDDGDLTLGMLISLPLEDEPSGGKMSGLSPKAPTPCLPAMPVRHWLRPAVGAARGDGPGGKRHRLSVHTGPVAGDAVQSQARS